MMNIIKWILLVALCVLVTEMIVMYTVFLIRYIKDDLWEKWWDE